MFWKSKKRIYLDYAASAPVSERSLSAFINNEKENSGNAGALYAEGVKAKKALENARKKIADIILCNPAEIIFTSGGTESNNLALFGALRAFREKFPGKTPHLVMSSVEHPSLMEPAHVLEKEGVRVTYVPVDSGGFVNPNDIYGALTDDTFLVSVIFVNNEIGTVEPVKEIGKAVERFRREKKSTYPIFHTDACQAGNYFDLRPGPLRADLMSVNSAKLYGPKGIGFLYKKKTVPLEPVVFGGGQEGGLRSGTEPVSLAVSFAEAFSESAGIRERESKRLTLIRDWFFGELKRRVPSAGINGSLSGRSPNNINVSFSGMLAEEMILRLDAKGFSVSARSACASRDEEGSYVIMAIGGNETGAKESIRITTGRHTEKKDIEELLASIEQITEAFIK